MKTRSQFTLSLLLLTICVTAFGKIWRVDSNTGNWADFRTLQAAHDSSFVQVGDTLYVAGSPVNYGALTLTKKLVIIGPGYWLAENPATQANPAHAATGNITFQSGSAGSTIMGMYVTGVTYVYANNVTLRRNYYGNPIYMGTNSYSISNVVLSQSAINNIVYAQYTSTSITVSNNIIYGYLSGSSTSSLIVVNNVINWGGYGNPVAIENSQIENNVLYSGTSATTTNNTFSNNICNGSYIPASVSNQLSVSMSTVLELSGSQDGRYKLKAGTSPGIGAGTNGYDIGAFGGPGAYVLSGVPPIPAIYQVSAPTYGTSTQGLQVQVKTKSRN